MRTDPRLITVFLLLDLKAVQDTNPNTQLIQELTRLIAGDTFQEKTWAPRYGINVGVVNTAQQKLQWAQMESLSALTPAEDAARDHPTRLQRPHPYGAGAVRGALDGKSSCYLTSRRHPP